MTDLTTSTIHGWTVATSGFEDGEPRIRDIELAERLGYERPRAIRDLIERLVREEKLNDSELRRTVRQTPGRPAEEFWLTEAQSLKVVAKSETAKADALLDEVIRVFVAVRRGTLSLSPAIDVTALVQQVIAETLPSILQTVDQAVDSRVSSLSFGVVRPWELGALKRRLSAAADAAVRASAYPSRRSALSGLTMRVRTACGWTGTGSHMTRMPASMLPYAEREIAAIEREFQRSAPPPQLPLGGVR